MCEVMSAIDRNREAAKAKYKNWDRHAGNINKDAMTALLKKETNHDNSNSITIRNVHQATQDTQATPQGASSGYSLRAVLGHCFSLLSGQPKQTSTANG